MSATYNLEPPPTAKVLLTTTGGDILLELFAKQTPLASRNFLQLCLDGYYDGTIFHRLVPNFILQGGDPTGTGSGGESSFQNGSPFADEFHSRLKFNRRGLLGMANAGSKDDNASQFFLTLGDTPELTGKHTMFGRVQGDTIFNLVKMGDADVADGSDRPVYPEKIVKTEILVNPFDDMVKRDLSRRAQVVTEEKKAKKPKRKAGKAILSFGGDEEEDGDLMPAVKKPKFNPKFVSAGEEPPAKLNNTAMPKAPTKKTEQAVIEAMVPAKITQDTSTANAAPGIDVRKDIASRNQRSPSVSSSVSSEDYPAPSSSKDAIARTNAEIDALKASMRRSGPATAVEKTRKKTALEDMIPSTSSRGRRRGASGNNSGAAPSAAEQKTLDMLNAFKSRLKALPEEKAGADSIGEGDGGGLGSQKQNGDSHAAQEAEEDEDPEGTLCDLHFVPNCQSCTKWDQLPENEDEDVKEGWMSHKLSFARDRMGKNLEWKRKNEEELVVIDPREKARELGIRGKADRQRGDRDRARATATRAG